jgi:acetoacetyl-CoA synthetase
MSGKLLWTPSEERVKSSNVFRFISGLKARNIFKGDTFHDLWEWSVSNPRDFWSEIWDFSDVVGEKGERISNSESKFWEHRYFPDAKLNFAENLLKRQDDAPAIIFWGEEKVRKMLTC